jgi:hypothetical protein
MKVVLLEGKENVLTMRETASANSKISFEASFGASYFINSNT